MDPDNVNESKPVRPTIPTIEANASNLHPSKEQKILNELLFDSFGYVGRNGYLGKNKIINYQLENDAVRYRESLGVPRSYEPNHGLTPLLPELSSNQDIKGINKWLKGNRKRKLIWKAALGNSVQAKTALPDDINMQAPSHCLRYWEKPNFMNFEINTHYKPTNAFVGDGSDMNKIGMRSVYDTWRSPLQPGEPLKIPGIPDSKRQWQIKQHNHVHY